MRDFVVEKNSNHPYDFTVNPIPETTYEATSDEFFYEFPFSVCNKNECKIFFNDSQQQLHIFKFWE